MKKLDLIAKIGLCIISCIILLILVMPPYEGNMRSPVSKAMNDMRSLSRAIESYQADHQSCPTWGIGEDGVNYALDQENPAYHQPTFRRGVDGGKTGFFATLTTPVAYITQYPVDEFSANKKATFSYYIDGGQWILWSPGPDGKYDIDPKKDWDPKISQPSAQLMLKKYDPTNGMKNSAGDIFRVSWR